MAVQITGLEPSSAFLFKSALYPCVIEFTVKRDGGHTRPAAAAAAVAGGAGSTAAGGAAALPAQAGGAGGQQDDTATAAAGGGVSGGKGEGSSWLGQMKPKESSYKVRLATKDWGWKKACLVGLVRRYLQGG